MVDADFGFLLMITMAGKVGTLLLWIRLGTTVNSASTRKNEQGYTVI